MPVGRQGGEHAGRTPKPAAPEPRKRTAPADGGAHIRDRTGDLSLTKTVLYLLSYVGLQLPVRYAIRAAGTLPRPATSPACVSFAGGVYDSLPLRESPWSPWSWPDLDRSRRRDLNP